MNRVRLTYRVDVTLDLDYVDDDGRPAWAHQLDLAEVKSDRGPDFEALTILKNAINIQKALETSLTEEYGLDPAVQRHIHLDEYRRVHV